MAKRNDRIPLSWEERVALRTLRLLVQRGVIKSIATDPPPEP